MVDIVILVVHTEFLVVDIEILVDDIEENRKKIARKSHLYTYTLICFFEKTQNTSLFRNYNFTILQNLDNGMPFTKHKHIAPKYFAGSDDYRGCVQGMKA